MGKLLKVLGAVFLLLIVGFVGLLIWSHEKGEATQERFYAAVDTQDPEKVLELFDVRLLEKVDAPVLAMWMKAIHDNLGAFKGLAKSKFSTSSSKQDGHDRLESSGRIEFEKGEGESKLVFLDDKVIAFELRADAMPQPWFTGAPDTTLYRERAEVLLRALLANERELALREMHENLRKQVLDGSQFDRAYELGQKIGAVTDMTVVDESFSAEGTPSLDLRFTIGGKNARAIGRVGFQFTPWRGELIAFDVKPAP